MRIGCKALHPLTSLFIWEQVGIRAEFQAKVNDPYPEHNREQKSAR